MTLGSVAVLVLLIHGCMGAPFTANYTILEKYGGPSNNCDAPVGYTESVFTRVASCPPPPSTPPACVVGAGSESTITKCEELVFDPDLGPPSGYSDQYGYSGDCGNANLTSVIRRRLSTCLPSTAGPSVAIVFDCRTQPNLLSTNFYSDETCSTAIQTGGGLVTDQCFATSSSGRFVRCNNGGGSSAAGALVPLGWGELTLFTMIVVTIGQLPSVASF